MRYRIAISGETKEIDLKASIQAGPGNASKTKLERRYIADFGDGTVELTLLKSEQGKLFVAIADKICCITELKRTVSSITFVADRTVVRAALSRGDILSERSVSRSTGTSSSSSVASVSETVISNFPAKVVKVSAKPGQRIEADGTIVVLEAMKMEAQIKVPRSCTVTEVLVKEGDMVSRGGLLARLKFD
ncbi:MAG TPA: acetyl-CoA carboxylase biotin carboxyl carrier protein subunit [Nitrososphaerales archaeon]|nr:acetyl-CoA carboxylase biotin carboxyl carrier protein subunit [Nitrososphaerales archaeon]